LGKLVDVLTSPPKHDQVVNDCVRVVDEEVDGKGGLSGLAVKAAYATVKAVKPGIIASAVASLLPEFARKLEPFYDAWQAEAPTETLERFLVARRSAVAEALLAVTDARAQRAENPIVRKAYDKLRPSGKRHVEEAVPRVGRVLERHLR
jgi:hypothetical protein